MLFTLERFKVKERSNQYFKILENLPPSLFTLGEFKVIQRSEYFFKI